MHETLGHRYTVYVNSLYFVREEKVPFTPLGSSLKKRNVAQYENPGSCAHIVTLSKQTSEKINKNRSESTFCPMMRNVVVLPALRFAAFLQRAGLLSTGEELGMSYCPKPINSHLNGCCENGSKGCSDILLLNLLCFL